MYSIKSIRFAVIQRYSYKYPLIDNQFKWLLSMSTLVLCFAKDKVQALSKLIDKTLKRVSERKLDQRGSTSKIEFCLSFDFEASDLIVDKKYV